MQEREEDGEGKSRLMPIEVPSSLFFVTGSLSDEV